jgi:serine/alanine adding enzyme
MTYATSPTGGQAIAPAVNGPSKSEASPAATRAAGSETLRVVRSLEEGRWATFVDHHDDGSIFHTPEMYRVFAEARHHRPAIWGTVDDEGEIRALMTPVTIATLGGPLRALTSRVVSFAGPLAGPLGEQPLERLLRAYRDDGPRVPVFTEIRHHVDGGELATALHACGFRHEGHLNFLVDLTQPEEELWRKVASSAKRNIQKARRQGVTIEDAADPADVAAGYEVLRDVYRRIRVPLPDRSLFDAAFRILGPLGRCRVVLARLGGRTIGVMTLLHFKGVVTYWYTGTLREYARLGAGDLLVAHAIESGRELGCRILDLGGAGRPDEPYGVRDFKAKYGGVLVDHGRDIWVRSPARMRVATTGYGLIRRFL